jgi:cell division protein FtsI/penicillin-binding protein 2
MTLNGKKISNFDGKARGVIPMQEILSQSLNVGAATIALKVGKDDFSKYFLNFGLGNKTGIDLPNEATGMANNLKSGRDIEIATAAYGQGVAVSPITMATALSILANSGYVVKPHLVKEIDYANGKVKEIGLEKSGPFLKKETTDEVTKMLVKVVDESLLKGAIKMDRYSIAAKTGTAQIPDHVNGGYYSDRYLHSFFGYFPAYNPKYLVFLFQVYPKGAEYASATLTEPFDQMAKFLIDYYNIPPDR